MNRVFLVRHGLSSIDFDRRAPDWRRSSWLTEEGALDAMRTARYFARTPIDEILCSPAAPTRDTARVIGATFGLRATVGQRLRGIGVGSLARSRPKASLVSYASLLAEWISGYTERSFPGGEGFKSVWTRTRAVMTAQLAIGAVPFALWLGVVRGLDASWHAARLNRLPR